MSQGGSAVAEHASDLEMSDTDSLLAEGIDFNAELDNCHSKAHNRLSSIY